MGGAQSKEGNASRALVEERAATNTAAAAVAATHGVAASPTAISRKNSGSGSGRTSTSTSSNKSEHEKDHALVLDLMEYFCYAVKVSFN